MKIQLKFNLHKGTLGGRRPNSGRKRIHSKGVSHITRETVNSRTPLHINFKVKLQIKNKTALKYLARAIYKAREKGLKINHFSLQHNHVHLIVEAKDNQTLTKGMRALTISFAKNINQGRIQIERYHLHVLKSLKETQNAVKYVILNEMKHSKIRRLIVDGYSSVDKIGIQGVRQLVKTEKISLIWRDISSIKLDPPISWLLRRQSATLTT